MHLDLLPPPWQDLARGRASFLHQRHARRLPVLLLGAPFAKGRRTVTTWLRAAGAAAGFPGYSYFLAALVRRRSPTVYRLQRQPQQLRVLAELLQHMGRSLHHPDVLRRRTTAFTSRGGE